jgi:hypothetical protein
MHVNARMRMHMAMRLRRRSGFTAAACQAASTEASATHSYYSRAESGKFERLHVEVHYSKLALLARVGAGSDAEADCQSSARSGAEPDAHGVGHGRVVVRHDELIGSILQVGEQFCVIMNIVCMCIRDMA